jgi:hypothetical protein
MTIVFTSLVLTLPVFTSQCYYDHQLTIVLLKVLLEAVLFDKIPTTNDQLLPDLKQQI